MTAVIPEFHCECSICKKRMREGEFMALIGSVPAGPIIVPISSSGALSSVLGKTYCGACFKEIQ